MRTARQRLKGGNGQRGDIVVMFLAVLVPVLLAIGLAVDLGSAYIAHANLANAVDAGALAAVRANGSNDMQDVALRVAKTNYTQGDTVAYSYSSTSVGSTGLRVELRADYQAPAYFSRLFGNESFAVSAIATAIRYPVDLSIVIDTSSSLLPGGVWTQLKGDANDFLENFNENTDRIGIVSFSTMAREEMEVRQDFIIPGQQAVNALDTQEDTNMGEALQIARSQLNAVTPREEARRFVLLVTDGRPTAVHGSVPMPTPPPAGYDGVVAAKSTAFGYRGLFTRATGEKVVGFDGTGAPILESNGSATPSPVPVHLPFSIPLTDGNIRNLGRILAEYHANTIRGDDVTIHAIGILPPSPAFPLDTPDLEMLRRIANVGGMSNGTQPQGEVLWARPEDLADMFAEIARKILITQLVES